MPRTRTVTWVESELRKGSHLRDLPQVAPLFSGNPSSRETAGARVCGGDSLPQLVPGEGASRFLLSSPLGRTYDVTVLGAQTGRKNRDVTDRGAEVRHCGSNPPRAPSLRRKDPAGPESPGRCWDPLPRPAPQRPRRLASPASSPSPELKGEPAFLDHVPKFPGQLLNDGSMKPDGKVVLLGDMNVGKTSLLHRYMERRFQDTVSTVGGAFYLKQWGQYNISIWDTAGERGGSGSRGSVPAACDWPGVTTPAFSCLSKARQLPSLPRLVIGRAFVPLVESKLRPTRPRPRAK